MISNLAGNQVTNFPKRYAEFGLTFPIAGFGFDTALAWAAGKDTFIATRPVVWHHLLDTPGSKRFIADLRARYRRLPGNQAWGDHVAMKTIAQSMTELRSTEPQKLIAHWEKGARFDRLKTREGYFRASDHQLTHEMHAVEGLGTRSPNAWDIVRSSGPVPLASPWRRSRRRPRRASAG